VQVATGVRVNPQEQVELQGLELHHAVQIARFEIGVEGELVGVVNGGVGALEGAVVYAQSVVLLASLS
jgi:hypothetical protein